MSDTVPPSSERHVFEEHVPEAGPLDEDLEALAAGEVAGPKEAALRAAVRDDPATAARYARILRVERALRTLTVEAAGEDFVARVVLGLPSPVRASRPALLGRFAAAAASFALAVFAFSEAAPAMANEVPIASVVAAFAPAADLSAGPPEAWEEVAAQGRAVPAAGWAALGMVLVALGPLLAHRWRLPAPPRRPA